MDVAAGSGITIRPATTGDAEFLFGLWTAVRGPACEDGDTDRLTPLRHQFRAEAERHRVTHPAATHHVVELDRRPIGQCRLGPHPDPVERERRAGNALVLVDLSIAPAHQHLAPDVVAALHRHAEWFGAELWADEAACTRHDGARSDDAWNERACDGHADREPPGLDRVGPGG